MVWGYALAWFFVNDRAKLLTYWVLDRAKVTAKSQPDTTPQPGGEATAKPAPNAALVPVAKTPPQGTQDPVPAPQTAIKSNTAVKPDQKTAVKPEAAPSSEPEVKASHASGDDALAPPSVAIAPGSQPQTELSAKADEKLEMETDVGVAKLIDTTLGDILLAGVLRHPEDAGRIIAEAISNAEAPKAAVAPIKSEAAPGEKIAASHQTDARSKEPSANPRETVK